MWKLPQYERIWEALREDFELEDRWTFLDTKLSLIEKQTHFLLEILQNRKSNTLEWTIIVLIFLEICVSLYDIFIKNGGS